MIRIQIKSISFFILILMQVTCSKNMRQQQNASKPDGSTIAQLPVSDTKVQAVPVQPAAESAVVAELRKELERLREQHTADVQALAALKQQCGQARSVDAGETMNQGVGIGENPASIVSSHPTSLVKKGSFAQCVYLSDNQKLSLQKIKANLQYIHQEINDISISAGILLNIDRIIDDEGNELHTQDARIARMNINETKEKRTYLTIEQMRRKMLLVQKDLPVIWNFFTDCVHFKTKKAP